MHRPGSTSYLIIFAKKRRSFDSDSIARYIGSMSTLNQITEFLTREFSLDQYQDVSLNGLQVEGSPDVTKVAAAVDSGLSVLRACAERKAEVLLVHHGLYWGSPIAIRGPHREVVQTLLDNKISLVAIHLPLDAHPQYGNNALLAGFIGLENLKPAVEYKGNTIGFVGENSAKQTLEDMRQKLQTLQGCTTDFVSLPFGPKTPERVCVISGSGADELQNYQKDSFDTLITGEPKQFAYHFCKEHGLNALFPGHYATETLGVKRAAELLADTFNLSWEFIDEPTGI